MRVSARQQHCLQAMGIVPWVSRYAVAIEQAEEVVDDAEVAGVAEVVAVAEVAEVAQLTDAAEVADVAAIATRSDLQSSAPPPESADKLGEWVSSRALVPIHYRGSEFPVLGAAAASVLVIVQQTGSQRATAALEGDSARLFALMLRSIQLTARDTRQCIVATEPLANPDISVAGVACTPQTRAVLLLMDPWPYDIADIDADGHAGRLPGVELPLWRIAHPQLLLEQPLLKRQSWQVLKSVQSVLTGSGSR